MPALQHKDKFSLDWVIFIGRFQPLHNGHLHVIQRALALSKNLLIMCGSVNLEKSEKNPWDFQERKEMIEDCLTASELERTKIVPLIDLKNDDLWVQEVVKLFQDNVPSDTNEKLRIGLIGHSKDQSSLYLKLFPFWDFIEVENYHNISATDIRNSLKNKGLDKIKNLVPIAIFQKLNIRLINELPS